MFGFLCKEPNCEKIAYIQMQYPCCPKTLLCSACEHKSTMTDDQLVWFVPPEVMDIIYKVSSYIYICVCTQCTYVAITQYCMQDVMIANTYNLKY